MDEKASEAPANEELDLVREWMAGVGGGVSIGRAKLKSVKVSKTGKKLTIVLKKPKKAGTEGDKPPSA